MPNRTSQNRGRGGRNHRRTPERGGERNRHDRGRADERNELKRSLPLYDGAETLGNTRFGFFSRNDGKGFKDGFPVHEPHPGLMFDKYIDTWDIDNCGNRLEQKPGKGKNDTDAAKAGSRRQWLSEATKEYGYLKQGLNATVERQKNFVNALAGRCFAFKTDWRFLSGLGNGHPFETGFIWHRTLGVPYLPGSSVKGLIRAWADPKKGWGNKDSWDAVRHLFGDTDDQGAGALIVFDALPIEVPKIELDIMNPHYGDYYNEVMVKVNGNDQPTPPADYLDPNPITFLTVAKTTFLFFLAPRPGCERSDGRSAAGDIEDGKKLLREALRWLGAGGKTAVGYGFMTADEHEQHRLDTERDQRNLSANQLRVNELKQFLAGLVTPVSSRVQSSLLQQAMDLLNEASKWDDAEDRRAAATALSEVFGIIGWGKGEQKRKRLAVMAALASAPSSASPTPPGEKSQ